MTSETTTDTRPLVKDMDEQARIAYLASLMGKRVRLALTADTEPLLAIFHQYASIPWTSAYLVRLSAQKLEGRMQPVLVINTTRYFMGAPIPVSGTLVPFGQLYDVELDEPTEPPFTPSDRDSEPDYDGADVYAADEVACPHCGHTLRITQRATVEAVREEEEGDTE